MYATSSETTTDDWDAACGPKTPAHATANPAMFDSLKKLLPPATPTCCGVRPNWGQSCGRSVVSAVAGPLAAIAASSPAHATAAAHRHRRRAMVQGLRTRAPVGLRPHAWGSA